MGAGAGMSAPAEPGAKPSVDDGSSASGKPAGRDADHVTNAPGDGAPGMGRANVAAVVFLALLSLFGYWAVTEFRKTSRLQLCIESGQTSCLRQRY